MRNRGVYRYRVPVHEARVLRFAKRHFRKWFV